jgi:transaldolase
VDRDNMFVKIPATAEGLSAITQVTGGVRNPV